MTLDDVVKLIETCKNAGVLKLRFEKLELLFPAQGPTATAAPAPNLSRVIEKEIEDDPDLNDLEMQNLMINDPLAFEAYKMRKVLGNVDDVE